MNSTQTVLKSTLIGIVVGLGMGSLSLLVTGNIFVFLAIGLIGMLVGLVVGFTHRNDP